MKKIVNTTGLCFHCKSTLEPDQKGRKQRLYCSIKCKKQYYKMHKPKGETPWTIEKKVLAFLKKHPNQNIVAITSGIGFPKSNFMISRVRNALVKLQALSLVKAALVHAREPIGAFHNLPIFYLSS